jgi:hypothetical protein
MQHELRGPSDMLGLPAFVTSQFSAFVKELHAFDPVEFPDVREYRPPANYWHNLLWVTKDMSDLVAAAGDNLPSDQPIDIGTLPFEGPTIAGFGGHFGGPDCHGNVLAWIPSTSSVTGKPGVVFHAYDTATNRRLGMGTWVGGTPPIDVPERFTPLLAAADAAGENPTAIIRVGIALWLLMTQPGITQTSDAWLDRASTRRARRAGKSAEVRVVDLRHATGAGQGHGHALTKRFIVRGHWRNQAYGPRSTLRRPTWIAPHIKGPDDAPLDTRPTVYRLGGSA